LSKYQAEFDVQGSETQNPIRQFLQLVEDDCGSKEKFRARFKYDPVTDVSTLKVSHTPIPTPTFEFGTSQGILSILDWYDNVFALLENNITPFVNFLIILQYIIPAGASAYFIRTISRKSASLRPNYQ
jgi:hypothetical protein